MMANHRPFRFGAVYFALENWAECARRVESLGYATLLLGEHPARGGPSPLLGLMAAANATTTLRLGTQVLANDFRNPVLLAQDVAIFDILSGGRFELGLGSGWLHQDYTSVGVPFERPGTRISRLAEAIALIKCLFQEEEITFSGDYYQVHGARVDPKPLQQPYPPLMIGGGGRRVLSLAGREADIVSLDPLGTADGTKDMATTTAAAVAEQLRWVRAAAGDRFDRLELHVLANVCVAQDRRRGAEQLIEFFKNVPGGMFVNAERTVEEVLESPRYLVGSVEEIAEQIQENRERYGISYISVLDFPGAPSSTEALGPVVARLAGK
jgi:probable F420-dependent oxidoreductase